MHLLVSFSSNAIGWRRGEKAEVNHSLVKGSVIIVLCGSAVFFQETDVKCTDKEGNQVKQSKT